MTKNQLINSITGNEIKGRAANRFFELRGYSNRHAGQDNIGDCQLWHSLVNAVEHSGSTELREQVKALSA
jgi:hypothetical protein